MTMAYNQTMKKKLVNLENEKNILWRSCCKIFISICNERKARSEVLNFSVLDLDEACWNSLSTLLESRNFSESVLMSFCINIAKSIIQLAEYDYLFFNHIKIKYFSALTSVRDWFWYRLTKVDGQLDAVLIDFVMEERVGFLYRKYINSRFQLWNVVNDVRVKLARSMSKNNSSTFMSSDHVMKKLLKIKDKMEKLQKHYNDWYKELGIRLENINWNSMNDSNSTIWKEVEEQIDNFEMSLCNNREDSLDTKQAPKKKKNYDIDDDNTFKEIDNHDLNKTSYSYNYEETTTIMNKHYEYPSTVSNNVPIFQPSLEISKEFKSSSACASSSSSFTSSSFSSQTEVCPSSTLGISSHSIPHETDSNHATTKTSNDLPRSELFTKYADNKNSSQVMRKIRDLFNDLNWSSTPDANNQTNHTTNM